MIASTVPAHTKILIVHPSADLYGADLQLVQTVAGLVEAGWHVTVALPAAGELVARLEAAGATVSFVRFPVLRKGSASPGALLSMLYQALRSVPRGIRLVRHLAPKVMLVNTVTLPWWLLVARLTRTPAVTHLHEAETQGRRLLRRILVAPLFLADAVIVISRSALDTMAEVQPRLRTRAVLIYNGVPQPDGEPEPPARGEPFRLVTISRLSPRKAPDVALEATALLRRAGYSVELEIAGTAFSGYEWYEDELRGRAAQEDLAGAVSFSGYCAPIWPVLERADVMLAPSLQEPFGNAVVEAQLAARPVVAAAAQGHLESVVDGETGLLVEPANAQAMADAVRRLIDDPALAGRLATAGRDEARRRFSVERYRRDVVELIGRIAG